jgi:hypothetical protein
MNREQRRSQGDYTKQKTLNFTEETLKNAIAKEMLQTIEKERMQATTKTVDLMLAIITIIMHDCHGYRKKRLHKLLLKIQSQFECIDDGTVSADELLSLSGKCLNGRAKNDK